MFARTPAVNEVLDTLVSPLTPVERPRFARLSAVSRVSSRRTARLTGHVRAGPPAAPVVPRRGWRVAWPECVIPLCALLSPQTSQQKRLLQKYGLGNLRHRYVTGSVTLPIDGGNVMR